MRRILLSHLMFAAGAFTTLAIINSESVRKCPPIQTLKYRLNEVKNKAKNSKFMACKDDLLKKFNDVQETLNNINLNDIGVDVLSAFKDLLKDIEYLIVDLEKYVSQKLDIEVNEETSM